MLNYKLLTVLAFILTLGISYDDAFAVFSPIQPNANVSYDSATNEIQVEWDYTTGGVNAPTTCFLKGDFWFVTDLNTTHGASSAQNNDPNHAFYNTSTTINGFIPKHYSVVSSSPTNLTYSIDTAEEVPCQGTTRIDIDTVMSHPTNVDVNGVPRQDLQIFLSFYAPTPAGEFSTLSTYFMDEVFVFYTPNDTWSTDAKDYACAGQAGNTIYIDQSAKGIHTNSGADCGVYLELDSNQWIDIADDKSQTPGTHNAGVFSLLIEVYEEIIIIRGGSGDDSKSRPTFGIDYKTSSQLVTNGLVINENAYNVTNNFYTPIPMQNMTVGATQNFTATIFAPHTLDTLEFLFGVPEVDKWNESEASIEIYTNYDGEITGEKINESDNDQPLINATSLQYSASKVKCNPQDNTQPCYRVSVQFSFSEAPIGKVLAVQAIDNTRKSQIVYYNDGLDVTGDSQNPPVTKQIISKIKYKGLQTVQLIDKEHNIWMTLDKLEPVLLYIQNDFGTFIPLEYRTFESTPDEARTNMDRLHSEFATMIEYEQQRAVNQFDSRLLESELPPAWQFDYPEETDRMLELQIAIRDAIKCAQKTLLEAYENSHHANKVSNNSKVGIMDEVVPHRTLGDMLAEERATKLIEATERSYLKQVLSTQN